jgi:hypothetical protein
MTRRTAVSCSHVTRRIGWLVLTAAIGLAGCSSSGTNPSEPADGGAGSGGTGGTGGALGTCTSGDTCVAAVPKGWNGPAALYIDQLGAPPEPCPTRYGKADSTVYSELDPGALGCNCSCGSPQGACKATVEFRAGDCSDTSVPASVTVSTSGCVDPVISSTPGSATVTDATVDGTCDGQLDSESRDTPTWTNKARLCDLAAPVACGSGVCAPKPADPFLGYICIYKDGVDSCPTDYGLKQQAFFRSISDDRLCDCACGSITNATCDGGVEFYTGGVCEGLAGGTVAFGDCGLDGAPINLSSTTQLDITATPSGGSCAVQSGVSGSATGAEPVTVCCR